MDELASRYRAAEPMGQADGMLITGSACVSIDWKPTDYGGPSDFWNAYPRLGRKSRNHAHIATAHVLRV